MNANTKHILQITANDSAWVPTLLAEADQWDSSAIHVDLAGSDIDFEDQAQTEKLHQDMKRHATKYEELTVIVSGLAELNSEQLAVARDAVASYQASHPEENIRVIWLAQPHTDDGSCAHRMGEIYCTLAPLLAA